MTTTAASTRLRELETRGVRIRPRALLTTMFARLLLGDLFFHGIGGAKYDQLTDAIVQEFFGFRPPAFAVLTATWKLPVAAPEHAAGQLREIKRLLRDLHFNPQRYVPLDERTQPLIAEKQRWIDNDAPDERRQRHSAIERLNAALQPFTAARAQRLLEQHDDCVPPAAPRPDSRLPRVFLLPLSGRLRARLPTGHLSEEL